MSSACIPIDNSHPANARCQIPPVAVPEQVSCFGLPRISASNSPSVCQGASARTINDAESSLIDISGVASACVNSVKPLQCIVFSSTVAIKIVYPSGWACKPWL